MNRKILNNILISIYLFSMVFDELVKSGQFAPKPDVLPPSVPMDYDWARVRSNLLI
jgi:hypothetical protein